jgi:spermidine/putrescine-binding protein
LPSGFCGRSGGRLLTGTISMIKRLLSFMLIGVICAGCHKKPKELNLYTWSEYFTQPVIDEFQKRTGIKVNQANYSTNEELVAKLSSGVSDYDIVIPSDYTVQVLVLDKKLMLLDRNQLPNFKNLDPKFLGRTFDAKNEYSVPLFWGTTGLGVNKDVIKEPIDSWAAVFDPKYAGKVSMLKDARENFAIALLLMGKSVNDTDPATLKMVADKLKEQAKLVKFYDSDSFDDKLRNNEAALVHGYNGQLAKVVSEKPDKYYYVVPKEGATEWIDNVCIPAGAPHSAEAHAFLNYLMDPQVAAGMVNDTRYASANAAARPLVDQAILKDVSVYPPDEVLKRCQLMLDIGPAATTVDRLWDEIRAK